MREMCASICFGIREESSLKNVAIFLAPVLSCFTILPSSRPISLHHKRPRAYHRNGAQLKLVPNKLRKDSL